MTNETASAPTEDEDHVEATGAVLHDAALSEREVEASAPERAVVVPVLETVDGPRFVLAMWPDWPHPTMLSLAPPVGDDTLEAAAADLVRARLHLDATGPARMSESRIPVRMASPRVGAQTTGWLRSVLQPVSGEPEVDLLLAGFEVYSLDEALAALSTEVERMALQAAADTAGFRPEDSSGG